MILRGYQTAAVSAIRAAFHEGARAPLYQLSTGGGKSLIFAEVARLAALKGSRVVILVHRRELLLQGSRSLREEGVPHGILAPKFPYTNAQVQIASIQTLVRRVKERHPPNLIIYDEAHHACTTTFRTIRAAWPEAKLLGVTATPLRTDGSGLSEMFDRLIVGPSMHELIQQGWLSPYEAWAPPVVADLSHIRTTGGDYNKKDLRVAMDRPKVTGDAVLHYRKYGRGGKAIIFTTTLDHSASVVEAFNSGGVPTEGIDGTLEQDERDAVMQRFRDGKTWALVSCELVSEGVDVPDASVAVLLRPTFSLGLYLQQVGRVLRPGPGKVAVILDHVGNIGTTDAPKHGLPDSEREWTLEGRKRRTGDLAPPMARCGLCFSCFPPPANGKCPACGADLPKREREPIESVAGELERVEARVTARREQGACRSLEELQALGRERGHRPQWAYLVWSARHRRVGATA